LVIRNCENKLLNDIEDDGGGVKRESSGGSWEKQVLNQTNISQLAIIYLYKLFVLLEKVDKTNF
jgi:hypothetical protein